MKNYIALFTLFLTACGSDGGQGSTPVTIATDANSCITSHNAPIEYDYLMVDKSAKNLVWPCGNLNNNIKRTEAFAPFDYALQCNVLVATVNSQECTTETQNPNPVFDVTVTDVDSFIGWIGGDSYSFVANAEATNTGNITAFGLGFKITTPYSASYYTGEVGNLDYYSSAKLIAVSDAAPVNNHTPFTLSLPSEVPPYSMDIEITSYFGDVLSSITVTDTP